MGKKSAVEDIDATKHALERVTRVSTMEQTSLTAMTDRLKQEQAEREQREQMIAQCFKAIGQVQTSNMFAKFATVSSLVWLKQVKEAKTYRDIPEVGTWDKFCDYVGMSRQKVDEDLSNLATFGEEFMTTCQQLHVGYRELRQLRQLSHDGAVQLNHDDNTITIEGEVIPIDGDHTEELQAAIEQIISAKNQLNQTAKKLIQDMNACVKEETKGLQIEKNALLEEVKRLKVFDPTEHDRDWSVGLMAEVHKASASLEVAIQKIIIDPRIVDDRPLQAQVWGHLNAAIAQLEDQDCRLRAAFYAEED